jgi:hypothetical protein
MLLCAEGKPEGKLGDAGEMKLELCVPKKLGWAGSNEGFETGRGELLFLTR